MSQPGIKLNLSLDIDGHPIKKIYSKAGTEIYEDGKYILKRRSPDSFDFETYKRFQALNPWCVKVHSFDDGMIVMDKIEGVKWDQYRLKASCQQLWDICVTHRNVVVKSFFDFMPKDNSTHVNYVDANTRIFFHQDAVHGNLMMVGDKPMYFDPDGSCKYPWDMFIQKIQYQTTQWFNEYLYYGHRCPQ